jgi:hypothetical protein
LIRGSLPNRGYQWEFTMLSADVLKALVVAFVTALLTHFGFYVAPPPTKASEQTPKKLKPAPQEDEDAAPKPKPKKKPKPDIEEFSDPIAAIGRIQFGNAGCTANVIAPRRKDGRYDVLTAAHCISSQGQRGTMELRNGKKFGVSVVVFDKRCDCCWLVTDGTQGILPTVRLSDGTPEVGDAVYHAGFGIDKPGNTEHGVLRAKPNSDGQCEFEISVSPGDSGGAIVHAKSGRVISPTCCTSVLGARGRVWGASPECCARLRPKPGARADWSPVEMPQRMDYPERMPELVG